MLCGLPLSLMTINGSQCVVGLLTSGSQRAGRQLTKGISCPDQRVHPMVSIWYVGYCFPCDQGQVNRTGCGACLEFPSHLAAVSYSPGHLPMHSSISIMSFSEPHSVSLSLQVHPSGNTRLQGPTKACQTPATGDQTTPKQTRGKMGTLLATFQLEKFCFPANWGQWCFIRRSLSLSPLPPLWPTIRALSGALSLLLGLLSQLPRVHCQEDALATLGVSMASGWRNTCPVGWLYSHTQHSDSTLAPHSSLSLPWSWPWIACYPSTNCHSQNNSRMLQTDLTLLSSQPIGKFFPISLKGWTNLLLHVCLSVLFPCLFFHWRLFGCR